MNDWMCPALKWDDALSARSRQGADEGADREARQVPSLSRQGRRCDSVPHAARRASEGRVLHARLRPHAVRRLHRGFDRVPDRARPPEAQVRHAPRRWCRRRCSPARARTTSASCRSAAATARCARRSISSKRRGVQLDYMRVRSFPFGQEVEEFLASHSLLFVVEQNRDAQLRSLLTLETAVEKAKLRSILHYSGLPMSSSVHRRRRACRAGRDGTRLRSELIARERSSTSASRSFP